jgi:hypothetical protein
VKIINTSAAAHSLFGREIQILKEGKIGGNSVAFTDGNAQRL